MFTSTKGITKDSQFFVVDKTSGERKFPLNDLGVGTYLDVQVPYSAISIAYFMEDKKIQERSLKVIHYYFCNELFKMKKFSLVYEEPKRVVDHEFICK